MSAGGKAAPGAGPRGSVIMLIDATSRGGAHDIVKYYLHWGADDEATRILGCVAERPV